jgi:HNH endonuclease
MQQRELNDGNLAAFRCNTKQWNRALKRVAIDVKRWPIEHLQNVGGETDEFLFRRSEIRDHRLTLLPGVAAVLRSFHPLVTQFVRGGWVGKVRKLEGNRSLLGNAADLHEFLFGSDRQTLEDFRAILQDYQSSRCFYCRKDVRAGDADHFVPWSRYTVDLGHNFVYACKPCNSSKRNYLANVDHLARWRDDNIAHGAALTQAFADRGLAYDLQRTDTVASWAYEQAERARAHGWIAKNQFARIDAAWRLVFFPLPAVAEPGADYRAEA